VAWLKRLETEHDNFRLALEWSGKYDPEGELRLAGALWWFWHVRGYLGEGRERLGAALRGAERHVELRRSEARARALVGVGLLAQVQGDYAEARPPLEESLTIFREGGDKQDITFCLNQLGFTVYEQGDYTLARSLLGESLAILRGGGSQRFIADCLDFLGLAAYEQGDHAEARSLFEESLTFSRDGGNKWGIAARLGHLGRAAYVQGDYSAARSLHEECLTIWRELGYKRGIAQSLESFARLAARGREWERAARLLGAAAALRDAIGAPPAPHRREEGERELDAARAALGEESFAASWAEGRAMPLEQAVAYALEEEG
jgi:tetratricopeptide (TPR) repeat protein